MPTRWLEDHWHTSHHDWRDRGRGEEWYAQSEKERCGDGGREPWKRERGHWDWRHHTEWQNKKDCWRHDDSDNEKNRRQGWDGFGAGKDVPLRVNVSGKVHSWNDGQGFGFLILDDSSLRQQHIFVHRSKLVDGSSLQVGSAVLFQVDWSDEKNKYFATSCKGAASRTIEAPRVSEDLSSFAAQWNLDIATKVWLSRCPTGVQDRVMDEFGVWASQYEDVPQAYVEGAALSDSLYIAGLPCNATYDLVKDLLQEFGPLVYCKILPGASDRVTVAAIASLENIEQARIALEDLNLAIPPGFRVPLHVKYSGRSFNKSDTVSPGNSSRGIDIYYSKAVRACARVFHLGCEIGDEVALAVFANDLEHKMPDYIEFPGIVRSWDDDRGYGFLVLACGGPAVFVHRHELADGIRLEEGSDILFTAHWDSEKSKLVATSCRGAYATDVQAKSLDDWLSAWGSRLNLTRPVVALLRTLPSAIANDIVHQVDQKCSASLSIQTNLFITGLPPSVTSTAVTTMFEHHGHVESCRVLPPSGRPDSAALVRMSNEEEARAAMHAFDQTEMFGHTLSIRPANHRSEPSTNLFVAGLPLGSTPQSIEQLVVDYSGFEVARCKVLAASGKPDQAALIEMGDLEQASLLIECLHQAELPGMAGCLQVRFAENRSTKGKANCQLVHDLVNAWKAKPRMGSQSTALPSASWSEHEPRQWSPSSFSPPGHLQRIATQEARSGSPMPYQTPKVKPTCAPHLRETRSRSPRRLIPTEKVLPKKFVFRPSKSS